MAQMVKRLPAMQETRVRSLGWEDPLGKEMAIHSSTLAWKIPWTEEPDRLQSMGSQRVGHDWANNCLKLEKSSPGRDHCSPAWWSGSMLAPWSLGPLKVTLPLGDPPTSLWARVEVGSSSWKWFSSAQSHKRIPGLPTVPFSVKATLSTPHQQPEKLRAWSLRKTSLMEKFFF